MELEQIYELYAWISRGKQRTAILRGFFKAMTPTQIRKESLEYNPKISLSNTSDILKCFANGGIAFCMNPMAKTGRIYKLTNMGEEVRALFVKRE